MRMRWIDKMIGAMILCACIFPGPAVDAGQKAGPVAKSALQGDAEAGRIVFNGKGVCYYCHGLEGQRDRLPKLEADTAALIARLNPPPPDLRNAKVLRLKSDPQRAHAIREGHPGTGMFPDKTMTDQELADVLAFLAQLRAQTHQGAGR